MPNARIQVRLRARAAREELAGVRDGALIAGVTAPPVDGRANRALCRLIARRAGVAPSRVSVVRGERSRDKLVEVEGVDEAALRAALGGAGKGVPPPAAQARERREGPPPAALGGKPERARPRGRE
jgi:uncharacterized protein